MFGQALAVAAFVLGLGSAKAAEVFAIDPPPGLAYSELDLVGGVDRVGSDTKTVSLFLDGEHLVFKKDSYQPIADGIFVWSGKTVQGQRATNLYVARTGDDVSIKLVKGGFEFDIIKDSRGNHELRATDLRNTVAEECLADGDHELDPGASEKTGTNSITTLAVAPPFEIIVNLAYTKAALAHFSSATALKNDFVIGLARTNDTLKNGNLNVRVKLGRVVFVKEYTEKSTLKLIREDVEAGLVPGLPVPIRPKNKTVLVVDVSFNFYDGTAMLGGPYAVIRHHVISTLTLAHEIGHLFGAIHQKAYQFTNGRYTVMAVYQNRSLREPIYSNPMVQWLGQPAGTSTLFNAKRMCNEFFELGPGCWITPQ